MFLVCHVALQDHMKKGRAALWWELLIVSYRFPKSGGHRHCGSGDIMILVFLMFLQDHMTDS